VVREVIKEVNEVREVYDLEKRKGAGRRRDRRLFS